VRLQVEFFQAVLSRREYNYPKPLPAYSKSGRIKVKYIVSRKFRDTLNLSFRRTATCLDVGEKSYEMNSLCNMGNTDLKNISEWSKQWLVKLNPTKTDIVYFNTRDIPPGLLFWIEYTRIYPVKCHEHLGISLSADCKWSNHINTIIEKNIQTSSSSAKT
jgi:hypothetical protein